MTASTRVRSTGPFKLRWAAERSGNAYNIVPIESDRLQAAPGFTMVRATANTWIGRVLRMPLTTCRLRSKLRQGIRPAYFELGDFDEQYGRDGQAIDQYLAVLELDANKGEAENAIVRILWHENRRDDAISHWRSALAAFDRIENRGVKVRESFWSGVATTFEEIGRAKQISALRPDMEQLLRGYININGGYRSEELLSSAMHACFESGEDYGWVLTLAGTIDWVPDELLNGLEREFHLTPEQQEESHDVGLPTR